MRRPAYTLLLLATLLAPLYGFGEGDSKPVHDRPNPYRTIDGWGTLPDGRKWGSSAGIDIDRAGNIWVAERCGANTCKGSSLALALDSRGRLFVANRRNNRIDLYDQDGTYLEAWKQFGRPSGLFIDGNDVLYVADSESNAERNPGWVRGIRMGSAKDGTVSNFIPDPTPEANPNTSAEGVAVGLDGAVYGAIQGAMKLQKHVRR